jgi:hypothetical protein
MVVQAKLILAVFLATNSMLSRPGVHPMTHLSLTSFREGRMDGERWSLCRSILVGHDAVPFSLLRPRLCHERRDMMGMGGREAGD